MIVIDCLGDICPVPVIKINKALINLTAGESIKIITDHSCVVQSIIDHFGKGKFKLLTEEVINGVWEILLTLN